MGAVLRTVVGQVSSSNTLVFTVSAPYGSSISMIQISSLQSSNRTVNVTIAPDGSTFRTLAYGIIVPPGASVGILTGTLNLPLGAKINMQSNGTTGDLEFVISMLDYS